MAKRKVRARKSKPTRKTARSRKAAPRSRKTTSARRAPRTSRPRALARKKQAGRSAQTNAARSRPARPKPAALQRERRRLPEDKISPSPPSTLGFDSKSSAAKTGHRMLDEQRRLHTEGGSMLTAGDLDADWNEAYSSGDEAPGGDNPTPDQDVVEEIGRALGVEYEDAEELKGAEKITERDRHRWEFDPASAEDYRDRNKKQ